MQAYFVTEDAFFLRLWEEIAACMIATQLHSDDPPIDGAWASAFDVNIREVFGSPADLGWGPWAIESGWTVADIISGLLMGLQRKQLAPVYAKK